jgi:hypothetical protein
MANDETKPDSSGCFAKGCVITILAGFTLLILFVGGTWYLYYKAVERFTSPQPVQIAIDPVTDAGYKGAEEMLNRLRAAATDGKKETIEFTATDLNALIARHPNFANPRRQIRISIAQSVMTVDMSVPLNGSRLPHLNGRWLNGIACFSMEYIHEQFNMTPKAFVANGHPLPQAIYSENFVSSFNRSFTRSFIDSLSRNGDAAAFWKNIRSITVRDDKLVVVTEPAA